LRNGVSVEHTERRKSPLRLMKLVHLFFKSVRIS